MKRLTTTTIQRTRVKPGTAVWVADDVEPGLRVRLSVTKSGLRRAVFFYRYRDRTTRKLTITKLGSFGSGDGLSLEDARSKTRELRAAIEKGIRAKTFLQKERGKGARLEDTTLRQLAISFSTYLDTTTLSEATKTTYRRYLRAIANAWPENSPDEITPDDCEGLFNQVMKHGVPALDLDGISLKYAAKRTRKGGHRAGGHLLATGSRFWERMKRQRVATTNPWSRMKELRERPEPDISDFHLDDEQIAEFLKIAPEVLNPRVRDACLLMLATGLRPKEVLGARIDELVLPSRTWRIPKTRLKYKKSDHTVYLSDYAHRVLVTQLEHQSNSYLFPGHGTKTPYLTADHLGASMSKLDIPGLTPKGFRATVRTGLQRLGCPEEVRSRMSHHQRLDRVAKSYDQYSYDDWWDVWGDHLKELSALSGS